MGGKTANALNKIFSANITKIVVILTAKVLSSENKCSNSKKKYEYTWSSAKMLNINDFV